jgi:hypothetical protein
MPGRGTLPERAWPGDRERRLLRRVRMSSTVRPGPRGRSSGGQVVRPAGYLGAGARSARPEQGALADPRRACAPARGDPAGATILLPAAISGASSPAGVNGCASGSHLGRPIGSQSSTREVAGTALRSSAPRSPPPGRSIGSDMPLVPLPPTGHSRGAPSWPTAGSSRCRHPSPPRSPDEIGGQRARDVDAVQCRNGLGITHCGAIAPM